jgi:hypothetical protein
VALLGLCLAAEVTLAVDLAGWVVAARRGRSGSLAGGAIVATVLADEGRRGGALLDHDGESGPGVDLNDFWRGLAEVVALDWWWMQWWRWEGWLRLVVVFWSGGRWIRSLRWNLILRFGVDDDDWAAAADADLFVLFFLRAAAEDAQWAEVDVEFSRVSLLLTYW